MVHKRDDPNMPKRSKMRKYFLMTTFITIALLILVYKSEDQIETRSKHFSLDFRKNSKIWRNFTEEEINKLSNLGKNLFLNIEVKSPIGGNVNHLYQILVWKYGKSIETRHLKTSLERSHPFEDCAVKNCELTYDDAAINSADLVLFHLQQMRGLQDLPNVKRNPRQIWAFLTDESPYHTFLRPKVKLSEFDSIFNWSMTYRMDSDIPVPYGRTTLRSNPRSDLHVDYLVPKNKRTDVLVAIMTSNCKHIKNGRWAYVMELQKHIKIDIYGKCGTLQCAGHFYTDCPKLDDYLFYLAFENANCEEYITEKLWWNAYQKNAIPIVMGANKLNYSRLLPPNSYLNIDDFVRPIDLANYIRYLSSSGEYKKFFQWKTEFEVQQEHGYFNSKSYHYCRVCEALNYNSRETKIYKNLSSFWNTESNCRPAWNQHE